MTLLLRVAKPQESGSKPWNRTIKYWFTNCPGVPWVQDLASGNWLALKSGNFGQENFFHEAAHENRKAFHDKREN